MIQVPAQASVFVMHESVNFRKGIDDVKSDQTHRIDVIHFPSAVQRARVPVVERGMGHVPLRG
ncbi:MAG: hypothetical protein JW940_03105, partial [Polyangiaceae bacterium]|nr:hypothetical protein [Polyangiaceae bacterium]